MTDTELASSIVESAQDAILYSDRDGVIRLWNDAASQMFGFSRDEALGASLDLIIPERFRERHWTGYRRVMETGVTSYADRLLAVPAAHSNREDWISIEFTVNLIRSGDEVAGCAAIIRDVTERRREERELKERAARAE